MSGWLLFRIAKDVQDLVANARFALRIFIRSCVPFGPCTCIAQQTAPSSPVAVPQINIPSYPDTTRGLEDLMHAMRTAANSGDQQTLVAYAGLLVLPAPMTGSVPYSVGVRWAVRKRSRDHRKYCGTYDCGHAEGRTERLLKHIDSMIPTITVRATRNIRSC